MSKSLGIFSPAHAKEIAQAAVLTGHEISIQLPGTPISPESKYNVPQGRLGISINVISTDSLVVLLIADISLRGDLNKKKRNP